MAELTARPDSWLDYLPGNWQQAVNTSPLLNALAKLAQRPTPDLTRGIEHDQYGSVSDRNWLLEQARGGPPKMNPLAAEMLDKGGLLANFLGPGVKLPSPAPAPIRVYHASPHSFDKVDLSKVGSGQGLNTYGHGFYTAENPNTMEWYVDFFKRRGSGWGKPEPKVNRYEMDLHVPQDRILDLDAPLSQQPEPVQAAVKAAVDPFMQTNKNLRKHGTAWDQPGSFYYHNLSHSLNQAERGQPTSLWDRFMRSTELPNHKPASDVLREKGIQDLKYLDQHSRSRGVGTANHVAIDDSIIEILRKYGLLPPVAAGTAAALNQQEPQQ